MTTNQSLIEQPKGPVTAGSIVTDHTREVIWGFGSTESDARDMVKDERPEWRPSEFGALDAFPAAQRLLG